MRTKGDRTLKVKRTKIGELRAPKSQAKSKYWIRLLTDPRDRGVSALVVWRTRNVRRLVRFLRAEMIRKVLAIKAGRKAFLDLR